MKIGIGADQNGLELQKNLNNFLKEKGYEITLYDSSKNADWDYPDVAVQVGKDILSGKLERAILICGTGIGMSIAANKVMGIRAALCHDVYGAERAELSNHAQIITFGAQVIGPKTAEKLAETYLQQHFIDGRSTPKINKISEYEKQFLKK